METDEPAEAWLEAANGQDWPLGANCSLGRSPSNTIVLGDRKVSRRHAVIHRQNVNEYWLVDLGSAVLNTEMALEFLPPEMAVRCQISNAPLVEGAITAALEASLGHDLDTVNQAAESAAHIQKVSL